MFTGMGDGFPLSAGRYHLWDGPPPYGATQSGASWLLSPRRTVMTEIAVIGIDIGKSSFHLVGLDLKGAIL